MNNPCLNWNFDIWPDTFTPKLGTLMIPGLFPPHREQIRNQAFAIGFFGFHYIRAVNENEIPLQKESLQILRNLADASNLDAGLIKQLHTSKKQSYSDYCDNVLIKVSLVLGDSHGQEIQYIVKLSFGLAAVYSCLYGVMMEDGSRHVKICLSVAEQGLFDVLTFAQRAEISEKTFESLIEITELIQCSKTCSTAYKCLNKLGLVINDLLCPVYRLGATRKFSN